MANGSPAGEEAHSDLPRAESSAPPAGTARGQAAGTPRGGGGGRPRGCTDGAPGWPRGAGRHGAAVPGPAPGPAPGPGPGPGPLLRAGRHREGTEVERRGCRLLPGLRGTWGRFYAFAPAPTLLPWLCLPACNVPLLSRALPSREQPAVRGEPPAPAASPAAAGARKIPRAAGAPLERLPHLFCHRFCRGQGWGRGAPRGGAGNGPGPGGCGTRPAPAPWDAQAGGAPGAVERSIPAPRCGNLRGYDDYFIIHLKYFKQGGYLNDNRGVVLELFC